MIVAREEGEVKFLEGYRNQYANLYPISCNGPLALIDGEPTQADLQNQDKSTIFRALTSLLCTILRKK
jgi:hypothetical protein